MKWAVLYPIIALVVSCGLLWSNQLPIALVILSDWVVPVSVIVLVVLGVVGLVILGAAAWRRRPRRRPRKNAKVRDLERVSQDILAQTDEFKGALIVLPIRLQEVFGDVLFIVEKDVNAQQFIELALRRHLNDLEALYLWLLRENRFMTFSTAESRVEGLQEKGADLNYQLTQWLRAFRLRAAIPEAESNPTLVELGRRLRDIAQQAQERFAALNESADVRSAVVC